MGVGADFHLKGVTVLEDNAFTFFLKRFVCVSAHVCACLPTCMYGCMCTCLWVNTQQRALHAFELQGTGVVECQVLRGYWDPNSSPHD